MEKMQIILDALGMKSLRLRLQLVLTQAAVHAARGARTERRPITWMPPADQEFAAIAGTIQVGNLKMIELAKMSTKRSASGWPWTILSLRCIAGEISGLLGPHWRGKSTHRMMLGRYGGARVTCQFAE